MPTVSLVKSDLRNVRSQYELVNDAIAGEQTVKRKGTKYLPRPNASDESAENRARYDAYKTRAVFYAVTGRTIRGMVGQIFNRKPELKYSPILQPVIDDATGVGVQIEQQIRKTTGTNISLGRAGLLSDFPTAESEGGFTQTQILSGEIRPTITFYSPEKIINWRKVRSGNKIVLMLVVLEEERITFADVFTEKKQKQWRVLRLDETGHYIQEVYFDDTTARQSYSAPQWADGKRMDYIPFEFIGSQDNDPDIDDVPAYDLASVNMGHYRNSADYEESVFLVGQPTLFINGLTDQFIEKYIKNKLLLGSQFGVPLPKDSKAELLQAQPNTLVAAAMDKKERQMVALGARLVQEKTVQRTATEANQEQSSESSQLSTCAQNVSAAYSNALWSCERFMTMNDSDPTLRLNDSFDLSLLDANQINSIVLAWQSEALTFGEMRSTFRRAGYASEPDDEALRKITAEVKLRLEQQPDPALNDPTEPKPAPAPGA